MLTVAKQPILNKEGKEVAFELLNRGGGESKSLEIIYLLANDIDFIDRIGEKRSYINLDEVTLLDDTIFLLSPKQVVWEILEDIDLSKEEVYRRLWEIKEKGYEIALDDFVCTKENFLKYEPFLPLFDTVKVEINGTSLQEEDIAVIEELKKIGAILLAEKVENIDQYTALKRMGFELFQGFFFARPIEKEEKRTDTSKIQIIELLNRIDKGISLEEIEEAIKRSPELAFALLRYINSPYFGLRQEVTGIKRALMLLGPKKLKQWLVLMLYGAKEEEQLQNPLYGLVLSRAKFLASLSKSLGQDSDRAYFVGLLSAADVVLKMPLQRVLELILVDTEVKEALLRKAGTLGKMLSLAIAHELGNKAVIVTLLQELNIREEAYAEAALAAL